MHLQAQQAVHHVHAVFFQLARPLDVALFVEARFQLQQHRDLLAVFHRLQQGVHDRRVAAHAVERDLDGQHIGIVRRLLQQADDRLERVEGMMQQDVATADGGEDVLFVVLQQGLPAAREQTARTSGRGGRTWRDRAPAPATAGRR